MAGSRLLMARGANGPLDLALASSLQLLPQMANENSGTVEESLQQVVPVRSMHRGRVGA